MLKGIYSTIVGGLSKYLVAILTGLLLAAGLATGVIYKQLDSARTEALQAAVVAQQYQDLANERKAALEASEALYEATITSLNTRAAAAEAQAKKFKEQNDALSKALAANRDWADAPIPDSVRNALKRP
uniref:Uncharacterized protein n=1 Tax=feces metagenome TaxID=1861841 RepID=A0A7M2QN55_9ZZZZ